MHFSFTSPHFLVSATCPHAHWSDSASRTSGATGGEERARGVDRATSRRARAGQAIGAVRTRGADVHRASGTLGAVLGAGARYRTERDGVETHVTLLAAGPRLLVPDVPHLGRHAAGGQVSNVVEERGVVDLAVRSRQGAAGPGRQSSGDRGAGTHRRPSRSPYRFPLLARGPDRRPVPQVRQHPGS